MHNLSAKRDRRIKNSAPLNIKRIVIIIFITIVIEIFYCFFICDDISRNYIITIICTAGILIMGIHFLFVSCRHHENPFHSDYMASPGIAGSFLNKIVYMFLLRASPLHRAVVRQEKGAAELLLARGTDINIKDQNGFTPLDWVAWDKDRKNISDWLVSRGASVNLHLAAVKDDKDLVKSILSKGTDVNKGPFGITPLHCCYNPEIASILISAGADVNSVNYAGDRPLHIACLHGYKEMAELLVSGGADINSVNYSGERPLHKASPEGHKDTVEFLLARGAEINVKDDYDRTPLEMAISEGHGEIARLLMSGGADVSVMPLHCASLAGDIYKAKVLIDGGTDVNIKNSYNLTPLHMAFTRDMAKFLMSGGACLKNSDEKMTPLHSASLYGHKETAGFFISEGIDVNCPDEDGSTPLHIACEYGRCDIAEFFIDKGASINCKNASGESPLHKAVNNEKKEIVKLLINKGADVDMKDNDGETPLHWSVSIQNMELTELLLSSGADVNVKDSEGLTPLYWAVSYEDKGLVEFLLSRGADINIKAKNEQTPLEWAGSDDMREFLVKRGA